MYHLLRFLGIKSHKNVPFLLVANCGFAGRTRVSRGAVGKAIRISQKSSQETHPRQAREDDGRYGRSSAIATGGAEETRAPFQTRILWLNRQAKFDGPLGVLMAIIHRSVVGQLSEIRQGVVHLLWCTFEESPATSEEQCVTAINVSLGE